MLSHRRHAVTVNSLSQSDFDISLYHQSLALRRRTFVDEMQWSLPTIGQFESDQYDSIFSHHLTISTGDRVVATMRLLPTTHNLFGSTYMILDAHRGNLPDMPRGILKEEIVSPRVWEASRLAVCKSVDPKDRNSVLSALIHEAQTFIKARGGDGMLGLMNPVFSRIFRRIGMSVEIFGPIVDQKDGPICVLKYDF